MDGAPRETFGKRFDEVVIATTMETSDDPIGSSFALTKGVGCFRGSLHDVLGSDFIRQRKNLRQRFACA